jgi:hypothetical protein
VVRASRTALAMLLVRHELDVMARRSSLGAKRCALAEALPKPQRLVWVKRKVD